MSTSDSRTNNKKALLIAWHFPPIGSSSGYLRTLKFAQYLPDFGYIPFVLTADTKSYDILDTNMLKLLPKNLKITRAFALNIKKHLSIKGKYPNFLAIPDQQSSWIPGAVYQALKIIKTEKINIIYSTYPVASAHIIGWVLHKWTKIPWIADFRDPMWLDEDFKYINATQVRARKYIENITAKNASILICNTNSIKQMLSNRYPFLKENNLLTILNGYDEDDFKNVDFKNKKNGVKRIIHAGLLERVNRDPYPFFEGVKDFHTRD